MLDVDTSLIVKLYVKQEHSPDVSNWLKENSEAIPLRTFDELELNNAINLKELRSEILKDEARLIKSRCA